MGIIWETLESCFILAVISIIVAIMFFVVLFALATIGIMGQYFLGGKKYQRWLVNKLNRGGK